MARSRKARARTAAKPWQYQKGEPPRTVTAVERMDRGRVIEVRWWVGHLKRFQRRSLGFGIRNERGVIVQELEQEAVRQTQAMYDAVMAGRDPQVLPEENEAPLTIAAGFELATRVPEGMYVVESEHLREVRRAARDIVRGIGSAPGGRPRTWESLSYSTVRELWLRLAKRHTDTGSGGPKWTERCVVILLQVSQWLAVEERIDRAVAVRRTWREQMRREWAQLTAAPIATSTPRHSEDEIRQIFASLDHPAVDPRIALAVELGAEARLGQVIRLMRSQLDLSPVGAFRLGRMVVHGAGKKLGVTRDLTPEERAAIDRALSGYLKHLEKAYRTGLRDDYPIFPSGRFKFDVPPSRWPKRAQDTPDAGPTRRAKLSVSNRPIGKRGLLDLFHRLEEVAGVTPVPGRGWYGIRRKAADLYEDYESDERVLNDQTGHRSSETRREVYQEKERERIRARSAETRRRVRAAAFGRKPGSADREVSSEAPPESSEGETQRGSSYPTTYPSPAHQGDEAGLG
jgi:integrase